MLKSLFSLTIISLVVNLSLTATIIITPLQKTPLQINGNLVRYTNSNSLIDSTLLAEVIRQYFGCFKFVNGVCIKCKDGYFLNEQGKCSVVSQNCRIFNLDQGICTQCIKGFYVVNGICFPNNQSNPIKDRCTIWSERYCLKCEKGFYLLKGACKAVDSQCRSWDINGKCEKCYSGFTLKNNTCQKSSQIKCKQNQFLNQKLTCQNLPQNCQTWDIQNGKCVQCFKAFNISEWKCLCSNQKSYCYNSRCSKYKLQNQKQCQVCQKGFNLNSKTFVCEQQKKQIKVQKPLPKNCNKWNENQTSCSQCNKNYILANNKVDCILEIINCTKYSQQGQCTICIDDYQIIEKKCVLKAVPMNVSEFYGCDTWNFNQSKCSFCHKNFDLNKQGICIYDEDHCLQRNQRDFCTKCEDGYKVKDGNCQVVISNENDNQDKIGCKMFDWVNNLCLVCEDQFIKNQNGFCQRPIENCLQMKNSKCIKCLINYELVKDECIPFSKSKCTQKDQNGNCKRCEDSFALMGGQCKTFKQLGTILLDYSQYTPQKLRDKIIVFTNEIKF